MNETNTGLGIGARLPRKEDARHLRGRGMFVADVAVPGVRDLAFVRSPVAHGTLRTVRIPDDIRESVFTADDLPGLTPPRVVIDVPGFKVSDHPQFATDKVRFAGECIAACLGATRAEAEDMAQRIDVAIDELPAVIDPLEARDAPAALLHEEWGDNVFVARTFEGGDVDSVSDAPVKVTREYRMNRQSTSPLEGRAALAWWDDRLDELVVYITSQTPHLTRTGLAEVLGLPVRQVHVISPDVGGGFGGKARLLPEEMITCAIALKTRTPVRWIEDRREHFLSATQARDHTYRITAHADAQGIIQAIDGELVVDAGAYALWHAGPFLEAGMAARNVTGPYDIPNYRVRTWTVATNKPALGVYRGVARPGACFAIERTIDEVARAVGRDPLEVRRDNMVTADMMPYRSVADMVFDNGDYPENLRRAAELVDYDGIRARQKSGEGKLVGVGLACYAEQTAHGAEEWVRRRTPIIPGYDTATARLMPDGTLQLLVGVHSHGQGMETSFAQLANTRIGIHPDDVSMRFGDTAVSPFGMGTFGSRSMVMGGGAVDKACVKLAGKMARIAAHLLQCQPSDIVFADGAAQGPAGAVSLAEIGHVAHMRQDALPQGMDPILDVTETYEPELSSGVFSYATHAAVVAVDVETGEVVLTDFVVVEDCGTIVNPLIVDGQIAGGVAQGVGTALFEETPYDAGGQPLATNFGDYLLPGAGEIPAIRIGHMVTPAETTPHGMKGMGEGGAIAPPAAVANALCDAFREWGAQFNETPISPRRVRAAILGAERSG